LKAQIYWVFFYIVDDEFGGFFNRYPKPPSSYNKS